MLKRYNNSNNITWIDIYNPSAEEITSIQEEFLFSRSISEELLSPTPRSACKTYDNCLYIIQHFPRIYSEARMYRKHEIDFILGENWIITIKYDDFKNVLDLENIYSNTIGGSYHSYTVGNFYIEILKEIYKKSYQVLDEIDVSLDKIEKNIFNNKERDMVTVLSRRMRDVIDFEHVFSQYDDILLYTGRFGKDKYGNNFLNSINNLNSQYEELISRIIFLKNTIKEFQSTNDSLLQHKTNETMKTLTMMSFVIFPLSLLASIFGMNADNIPIVGYKYDFEVIVGIMMVMSIGFFTYFKYKKWL